MIKKIDSKRFIKYLMSFIICMPLLFITAYASEIDTNFDIDSQIEASGVNELYNDLPEETAEYLKSTGLDSVNYKNFTELNAGKFIYSIIGITENEMKSPLIVAGLILGMLIFASLIKSGEHTLNSPLSSSFSNVMSAAIATVLVVPIVGLINDVSTVVSAACTFTEAFAPIFIGILLANGQTVLSAGYSSFLFGAIELTTICMDELLIPVL